MSRCLYELYIQPCNESELTTRTKWQIKGVQYLALAKMPLCFLNVKNVIVLTLVKPHKVDFLFGESVRKFCRILLIHLLNLYQISSSLSNYAHASRFFNKMGGGGGGGGGGKIQLHLVFLSHKLSNPS